jgi:hypothetical protein
MGTRLGTILGTQLGTVLGTDLAASASAPPVDPWVAIILATRGTNRFWFDYDTNVTPSGGNVATITDRIAGLVGVGIVPPAYGALSARGLRGASFVGGTHVSVTNALAAYFGARQPFTAMAVLKDDYTPNGTGVAAAFTDNTATDKHITAHATLVSASIGSDLAFRRNPSVVNTVGSVLPMPRRASIRTLQYDGTNVTAWIDGVQTIAPTARTESVPVNTFSMGGVVRSSTFAFFWIGTAWSYFVTDAILNAGELADLQEAMEQRYTKAPVGSMAFLFGGQSNSEGRDTDYSPLDPSWLSPGSNSRLKKFNGTSATPLFEPVNGTGTTHYYAFLNTLLNSAEFGSVPEFAAVPAPPVGGSAVLSWQKPGAYYTSMVTRGLAAKAAGYQLGGLVWDQGEAEAQGPGSGYLTFSVDTLQMIADLRADLGEPNLPVVINRLRNQAWTNASVRSDQAAFAAQPNIVVVDKVGTLIDGLHLSTSAQVTTGGDGAAAYIAEWG